ncbi:MAG: hypothetical protein LHV69_04340 [Elusimicrobia bacterium]|nr:hypothetical protein [Candidatus Obscuribacterium magneticum]
MDDRTKTKFIKLILMLVVGMVFLPTTVHARGRFRRDYLQGKLIWSMWEVDLRTGKQRVMAKPQNPKVTYARLSPDGKFVAYSIQEEMGQPTEGYVCLIPYDGAKEEIIYGGLNYEISDISWLPDSKAFSFVATEWRDKRINSSILYIVQVGQPRRMEELPVVKKHGFQHIGFVNWLPKGNEFVFTATKRDGRSQIFRCRSDGSNLAQVGNFPGASDISLSSDGEKIALSWKRDLLIMDVNGINIKQITNSQKVAEWFPYWSPDGKWVLYVARTGFYNLPKGVYCVNVEDGTIRYLYKYGFIPQWWAEPVNKNK